MNTTPHDNEYLAAIAGLPEQTISPVPKRPAVGDYCSGITNGRRWSGYVELADGDWLTINVGGGWVSVSARDITH